MIIYETRWPSVRWPSALIHVRILAAEHGKAA